MCIRMVVVVVVEPTDRLGGSGGGETVTKPLTYLVQSGPTVLVL